MKNSESTQQVFVVMTGSTTDEPSMVRVIGVFSTEKDAISFRNATYKEANYLEDKDIGPDLNDSYVDDGETFWSVRDTTLY